jgi:hypothetical protein
MLADGLPFLHHHPRLLVHAGAEIGEGDAGPHRIGEVRRVLDLARPVCLRRRDALGTAIVEDGVVEGAGLHAALKSVTVLSSAAGSSPSFARELGDRRARQIGGNSVGMNSVTDVESKMM